MRGGGAKKPVFAGLSAVLPPRGAEVRHARPAPKSFLPARAGQKASADAPAFRRRDGGGAGERGDGGLHKSRKSRIQGLKSQLFEDENEKNIENLIKYKTFIE